MPPANSAHQRLIDSIRVHRFVVVAYSGGVDSAVVARAAYSALGERAVAVTGVSASLATGELEIAREVAARIGIRHVEMETGELDREAYVRNAPDRCYHCKTELYTHLRDLAARFPGAVILNGANADDLGDYRPGMRAAAEFEVRSPLAECGLGKAAVRELAAAWGLPVWDKPATPCLSSRIAYGEEVTPERLRMIDRAEQWLRDAGFSQVRVRYHRGDLARLEVPLAELSRLAEPRLAEEVAGRLTALGFRFITLDLQGFRSGSLNSLLPLGNFVAGGGVES